jgi:hypothetical protein
VRKNAKWMIGRNASLRQGGWLPWAMLPCELGSEACSRILFAYIPSSTLGHPILLYYHSNVYHPSPAPKSSNNKHVFKGSTSSFVEIH